MIDRYATSIESAGAFQSIGTIGGIVPPQTRPLSASERAWTGPNPNAWFNLVRTIRLKRAVDPHAFRLAIDNLQEEFVELRSRLIAKPGNGFVLQECAAQIPVRLYSDGDDDALRDYLVEELRTPVGCDGTSLMRAALFSTDTASTDSATATIVLTVHHVIIDRNSTKTLIERLLCALDAAQHFDKSGTDRTRQETSYLGATRAAWSLLRERSFSAAGRRRPGLRSPISENTNFTIKSFDAPTTQALRTKAAALGVRVTALIAAATVSAFDRLYPAPGAGARVGIAMDLTSGERVAGLGSAVGMPTIDLRNTCEESLADLAHNLDMRTAKLRSSSAARDSASLFALCGPLLRFLARRTPVRLGTLAVTNLGDLGLANDSESSGLLETFGMVNNQQIYFDVSLHAQTLDGRMTLVFTSSVIDAAALDRFAEVWHSLVGGREPTASLDREALREENEQVYADS